MPATTSRRPATERQQTFIRTLVSERGADAIIAAGLSREVADALIGEPVRRDLIDRLMLVPRPATTSPNRAALTGASDLQTRPAAANRAGRMLLAGGIEATVTLPDGRHVTINIRTRARTNRGGWRNAAPREDGARTTIKILGSRVGWVNVDESGRWNVTLRTRRGEFKDAISALFGYAESARTDQEWGAYRVQEASRCGRCMLPLTDPVSIDRGIGPDCFGRDTGSQHVAAERGRVDLSISVDADPMSEQLNAASDAIVELIRQPVRDLAAEEAELNAEREAERRGFESDPDYQRFIQEQARRTPAEPAVRSDVERARDIIAEALDANDSPDMLFALRIFDRLAAGAS